MQSKFLLDEVAKKKAVGALTSTQSTDVEQKTDLIQYASFYYHRLVTLKPIVQKRAQDEFPSSA